MVFVAATAGGKAIVRPVPVRSARPKARGSPSIGELKEASQVIVEGNERVRPGQEVRAETKEDRVSRSKRLSN